MLKATKRGRESGGRSSSSWNPSSSTFNNRTLSRLSSKLLRFLIWSTLESTAIILIVRISRRKHNWSNTALEPTDFWKTLLVILRWIFLFWWSLCTFCVFVTHKIFTVLIYWMELWDRTFWLILFAQTSGMHLWMQCCLQNFTRFRMVMGYSAMIKSRRSCTFSLLTKATSWIYLIILKSASVSSCREVQVMEKMIRMGDVASKLWIGKELMRCRLCKICNPRFHIFVP